MSRYWIWVLGLGIGLAAAAEAQEVYRWKDEAGRTHFSNVGGPTGEATVEKSPSVETTGDEAAPAEPAAPAASASAGSGEDQSAYADLSEEAFSTTVSRKRAELQRRLRDVERRKSQLDAEKRSLRRARSQALDRYGAQLQGVERAPDVASDQEEEIEEKKQELDQEARAIREEYDGMRAESEKRFGQVPGWWRPLD